MATRKLDVFGGVADLCIGGSNMGRSDAHQVRRVSGVCVEYKALDRRQVRGAYKRSVYSEKTPDIGDRVSGLFCGRSACVRTAWQDVSIMQWCNSAGSRDRPK